MKDYLKTMKKLHTSFLFLSLTLLFTGCSKDDSDDNNTPAPTRLELLASHGWRLNAFYINGIDVTTTVFSLCELDNIFTYDSDYTYMIDEGPTKCNPGDPQIIETGNWSFANNQTMLIYEPGTPGEAEANIIQLDANNFKYEETEYDSTTMTSETYRAHFVKS